MLALRSLLLAASTIVTLTASALGSEPQGSVLASRANAALPPRWLDRFRLGWTAFERQEYDMAERAWMACLELTPENATTAYHLACLHAKQVHNGEALAWLQRAVSWGYADVDVLRWDPDLASIRSASAFDEIVRQTGEALTRTVGPSVDSASCSVEPPGVTPILSVSPDGTMFARAVGAEDVRLVNVANGTTRATLSAPGNTRIALSKDCKRVATTMSDGRIAVFEVEGSRRISAWQALRGTALHPHRSWSYFAGLAFDPTGQKLLSFDADAPPSVWDVEQGTLSVQLGPEITFLRSAAWSPDGSRIATSDADRCVRLWDAHTGLVSGEPFKHPTDVDFVCFDPTGQRLLTGTGDACARVWDIARHEVLFVPSHAAQDLGGDMHVCHGEFSADGSRIVTATFTAADVAVWDARTGSEIWHYDFGSGNGWRMYARFDDRAERVYASGQAYYGSRIFEAVKGTTIMDFEGEHTVDVRPVPGDRYVLTSSREGVFVREHDSLKARYVRLDFERGSLLSTPSSFFEGDAQAIESARIHVGAWLHPLDSYAALLFDPKRVRASIVGINVRSTRMPMLPMVSISTDWTGRETVDSDKLWIEAMCESDAPLRGFLIDQDGTERFVLAEKGSHSARIRISKPAPSETTHLRLRAMDSFGLLSRPVDREIAYPCPK